MNVNDKLTLPCGAVIPNRIAKSAMSENMAKPKFYPNEKFFNAYKAWTEGEVGLCISGNVMVDIDHLGEANNVVIDQRIDNQKELALWAKASEGSGCHIWLQLNHPGKQSPKYLNANPVAPSAVSLKPPLDKMFNEPRELSEDQIKDIIKRFGYAAMISKKSGFEGVQIHGAHGYLVSQFLSPAHNKRSDKWGGTIDNRMRFVTEVYEEIRHKVGDNFPVGIKINSADFGRGGFTNTEAVYVAKSLSELGIDLIELSGGNYETPVMTGKPIKQSTSKREAYFLEYSEEIKKAIECPLMVTGGFRTAQFIKATLKEEELDIVGMGRALCLNPNFPKQLISGKNVVSEVRPLSSGFKVIDSIFPLEIIWYTMQIHRLGKGKSPNPKAGVFTAIFLSVWEIGMESIKRVRPTKR